MKKKVKKWAAAAGVILVFFAAAAAFGGRKNKKTEVSVIPLEKRGIQETLVLTGPVSGTDSVDVVSNIHAEIRSINVKEGDRVKKGQVLAVLDQENLEREVSIAQNTYDAAVVTKEEKDKEAALGYEKASQDFAKAQADHGRLLELSAGGFISKAELEQSANALNDARRQLESYTVENGKGRADRSYELQISNAAFALEKKKEELENARIKSPIDGTVVRVNSKVGQFADKVEDDKPIFCIENLEQLELEIKVSEFSIGKVKVGQKALISADILNGQEEEGVVAKISPTGEEKGGGSTERVIPASIQVTGENTRLMAGITARAELLINEAEDAFVVPVSALSDSENGTQIVLVQEGKIHLVPVEIGVDGDVEVQIIPTDETVLEPEMQGVSEPSEELKEGMEVQVREGKQGA